MTLPYHLKIAPMAQHTFNSMDMKTQKIALKTIKTLAMNPHPPHVKRIEGMTGLYRQVIDKTHFIYKVEENEVLLLFIKTL